MIRTKTNCCRSIRTKKGGVGIAILISALVTFIVTIAAVGGGVYYWQKSSCEREREAITGLDNSSSDSSTNDDYSDYNNFEDELVTLNASEATTRTMTFDGDAPVDITEQFMLATLGTLPGADVDYDEAKELSSADLLSRWSGDYFVPQFYGIQNGPDTFEVKYQATRGDESIVRVDVLYGEMMQAWAFGLVYEGGSWKVDSFRNDAQ